LTHEQEVLKKHKLTKEFINNHKDGEKDQKEIEYDEKSLKYANKLLKEMKILKNYRN
jgi:hypothetical protein